MIFLCIVLAFYLAMMMGANDVANSMGTSVGSGVLSLGKAIAIAAVMEFIGAVWFGQNVSNTIATGILTPTVFQTNPQQLLLGMLTVLFACGVWLNLANWRKLPVSSSHAVIGSLVGFGLVAQGSEAINWTEIGTISLAWIVTPLISGTLSFTCIKFLQRWIHDDNLLEWIPWLSVGVFCVIGFSVAEQFNSLDSNYLTLGVGVIAVCAFTFWLWVKVERSTEQSEQSIVAVFSQLQILSASFVAFAHGSNDVSHAIAPLAVAVELVYTGVVPQSAQLTIALWIFVLGGVGIVTGLWLWGKNVIATVGKHITAINPQNGFAAEISTACTILMGSHIGLPLSTTHALVGAVVGVGLSKSDHSIDLQVLKQIGMAWLVTIPASAILGATIYKAIGLFVDGNF